MNMLQKIEKSLIAKAKKSNIDLSGIKLQSKTLDCTWGDSVGIEISGVDAKYLERVRNYVKNWLIKFESPLRKINYQVSPRIHSETVVFWAYFPCND